MTHRSEETQGIVVETSQGPLELEAWLHISGSGSPPPLRSPRTAMLIVLNLRVSVKKPPNILSLFQV